ncbi:MAG: BirA family transcriptional regulator [Verrucomicrobiota bacterium]|jgi:BirA family biotin operon repressor/biotin-[acetyl-CoA-carboxylase] ligase
MSRRDVSGDLNAGKLQAGAGGRIIGREIAVIKSTTSTNDFILQKISPATPEGLVVFAEQQTAGRGQRGNRWESPAGQGLWFSVFLRPELDLQDSAALTTWAAKSVSHSIAHEFALETKIKAPNDIYLNGLKVAGVLVEMRAQEKARHFAVAGIGVNVNQSIEDFPKELRGRAISLAMALERRVDRQEFAIALLRQLDQTYSELFR